MACIKYKDVRFNASSKTIINQANSILAEYAQRGRVVTLRQLYYQFVSRDLLANKQTEYKRLGSIINDARLAGFIDWDYLQDRTRNLAKLSSWGDPSEIISSAARSYHRNLWEDQTSYVEVWIEKDALLGVIEDVCQKWDVPYFSCRGYTSQSEMWGAAMRLKHYERRRRQTRIIHLGDHDPSGKDMSRDIEDRLAMFGSSVILNRIALNMDQVRQYEPPPNPAKITDSRATAYIEEFGDESWELDALDPDILVELIEKEITEHVDMDLFEAAKDRQEEERKVLAKCSNKWDNVTEFLEDIDD